MFQRGRFYKEIFTYDIRNPQYENEDLDSHVTDYSIGKEVIYATFSWSTAEEAYELTRKLAKKYDMGFFDVSENDGDIILPDGTTLK